MAGFLGTPTITTPLQKRQDFIDQWQPTFGFAAETAFDHTRQLFGMKPLSDLQEVANMRGFHGVMAIPEMYSDEHPPDQSRSLLLQRTQPTSRLLDPDEANERFGIEDRLKFTEPILEDEAKFKQLRAEEELAREFILAKNQGFLNNLGTFAIEFIADITDPIGLASLLFPITSYGKVAKLTKSLGRGTSFAVGAAEASASMLIPLTPGYYASKEFQYNFTPSDYGVSLAGGAVLGGFIRKWLFNRETRGIQELRTNAESVIREAKADLEKIKGKIDDQKPGSEQLKEDLKDPEVTAQGRQQATTDIVNDITDTSRATKINDLVNHSVKYRPEYLGRMNSLDEAEAALTEINNDISFTHDLLATTVEEEDRILLKELRVLLGEYKEATLARKKSLEKTKAQVNKEDPPPIIKQEQPKIEENYHLNGLNKLFHGLRTKLRKAPNDKKAIKSIRSGIDSAMIKVFGKDAWSAVKDKGAIIDELTSREKDHTIEELVDLIADKIDPTKVDELKAAMLEKNQRFLKQRQQEESSDGLVRNYDKPEEQELEINQEMLENEGADGTNGPLLPEELVTHNDERIIEMKNSEAYRNDPGYAAEVDGIEEGLRSGRLGANRVEEGLDAVEACQRQINGDMQ